MLDAVSSSQRRFDHSFYATGIYITLVVRLAFSNPHPMLFSLFNRSKGNCVWSVV